MLLSPVQDVGVQVVTVCGGEGVKAKVAVEPWKEHKVMSNPEGIYSFHMWILIRTAKTYT
jgi:hypothetical protein